MTEDIENKFLQGVFESLKKNYLKVIDHAEELNQVNKRILSIEKTKLEDYDNVDN